MGKILNEKRRFYLYNPVFAKKCRVNLVQVWDYSSEDTITFNLLYTFEKENQIVQREIVDDEKVKIHQIFEEKYYPIKKEMILSKLKMMGYTNISVYCFPSYFKMPEFELVDWYCIMAKKND